MKIPRFLLPVLLSAAHTTLAQNNVWTGTNGANWNVSGNWSLGSVPTAGSVFIVNGNTALVNDDRSGGTIGNTFVGQGGGNGGLEVTTGGSLKLGGLLMGRDNARVGTLTLSGGALAVNQLYVGDGRGNVSGGSATATISSGSVTVNSQFTIGASANGNTTGTVTVDGGSVTSTNLIVGDAGAGTLVQNGGTFTVTGTEFVIAKNSTKNSTMNLQGGTMNASNAIIQIGSTNTGTGSLGLFSGATLNAAGILVASGSTLTDLGGTINITGGITNNGSWIFSPGTALTRSYSIVGSGSLTKNGAGVLTLAATNGYTGDTILNVANIRLGIANAISTNSVFRFGAVNQARRLQLEGYNQTLAGVDSTGASGTLIIEAAADNVSNAPATLTLNAAAGQSYNFSGIVRSAAGTATNSALTLVKNGAGTQVFSGGANVSYSGTSTVNAGVLEFGGTNTVANNSAITLGGGTVRFSGGGTRSNTISGTGNLEKTGANTLTLSGSNNYTGLTTLNGGTLRLGGANALRLNNETGLVFTSGTLDLNGFNATLNNFTLSAGSEILLGGGNLRMGLTDTGRTFSGVISGSGNVTKDGTQQLVLDVQQTYTGDTILRAGNIRNGTADALPTGTVLRFDTNSLNRRLQLQGFDQTLAGVDSTSATGGVLIIEAAADGVNDAPAILTLNVAADESHNFGGIARSASGGTNSDLTLIKDGAGTQVLSGTSANVTYSGNTTINAGVLEFAGANSVANNSAITLGGGTVRFSGGGTRSNTISGSSGALEKTGANTLTLSGNNSFSGAVSVQAGLLELNSTGGAAAGSAASVSVASGATLLISQSDQVSNTAAVTLSGGTIQRGAGVSEVFGNLNITTGSFLDFGTGTAGTLSFGTYTPSSLLTVQNFGVGNTLTFGSDLTTTINNGSLFSFDNGFNSSWDGGTSTFTITAIPEPSTYLTAAGLLAVLMWPSRRRLLKDAKSILGLRGPMRDRLLRRG